MDNLLILQCDRENQMKRLAERIYNMKLLVNMPVTDEDFAKKQERWRDELKDIEKLKI